MEDKPIREHNVQYLNSKYVILGDFVIDHFHSDSSL